MRRNVEQIIGAKAGSAAFIMRDLPLSMLLPASLNSDVRRSCLTLGMAIIYELWAECENEASLHKLKGHFDGLSHKLLSGCTIEFSTEVVSPYSEVYGLTVRSKQLSNYGVTKLQDALDVTEAGFFLYHHLKTAPDFRFARIAWDAENITTVELFDFFETSPNGKTQTGLHCVLDDELYKQLGSPIFFWQFRKGYWWRKFRGESYEPLFTGDQKDLRELCEQFLPDNFDYSNGVL